MTKTSVTLSANARSGRNGFLRCVRVGGLIAVIAVIAGAATAWAKPFKQLSVLAGQPGGAGSCDTRQSVSRFSFPSAIAFDGKAYFYVADTQNSTIRKINAGGVVSTLAGEAGLTWTTDGKGKLARFNHPAGIAYDGAGHLFVADTGNQTIREIKISSKAVTTVAGVPGVAGSLDGPALSAKFNQPSGLAYNAIGILYVSDSANDTIRAFAVVSGSVATLAGLAGVASAVDGPLNLARFNDPVGLAFDGSKKIFIADADNDTVRQIDFGTGLVSTIAGSPGAPGHTDGVGASARFQHPLGLAWDGASLYVADAANDTLRKLDPTSSLVTTVAGTPGAAGSVDGIAGAARFSFPSGLAFDSVSGNIFITDTDNSTVRGCTRSFAGAFTFAGLAPSPGNANGLGTAAQFNGAAGLVHAAGSGITYVADTRNETIRSIDASGNVTTVAGSGAAGSADGVGTAASFKGPVGLALDNADDLLVADTQNDTIHLLTLSTNSVLTLAGQAGSPGSNDGFRTSARFNQPSGLMFDSQDSLYIVDSNNNTIRKLDITGQVTTVAGSAGSVGTADGAGGSARFNHPVGIAYDGSAFFYIADTGNDTIRKMDASGNVTTFAGAAGIVGAKNGKGTAATFNQPTGIVYNGAGDLFVADSRNSLVREIVVASGKVSTALGVADSAGVIAATPTTFKGFGKSPGGLNDPVGLAFGATTGLYIADEAENVVLIAH